METPQNISLSFDRLKLLKTLAAEKKNLKKRFLTQESEIRVTDSKTTLQFYGYMYELEKNDVNNCIISLPLKILYAYASTIKAPILSLTFQNGKVICGSSIYPSSLIKLQIN